MQILEHVAADLGLDAALVKQRNFISAPEQCEPDPFLPADGVAMATSQADGGATANSAVASGSAGVAADAGGTAEVGGAAGFPVAFSVAADGTPEAAPPTARDGSDEDRSSAWQRPCFAGPAAGLAEGDQVETSLHSQALGLTRLSVVQSICQTERQTSTSVR